MTETNKFTPGPWRVQIGVDSKQPYIVAVGTITITPSLATFNVKDVHANARLIAAAPALYEAARFAASVLKANPIEMSERMALEKLDAATALVDGPQATEESK